MRLKTLTSWYLRNERWISSLSLVGGFIFDIFALKRIDLFWDNLWVAAHLLVAAIAIILINLYQNRQQSFTELVAARIHFWLIIAIQFAFGGLLSTFLVFYFRSGALSTSWPFLLLLAILFALNEILKKHYTRLVFQTSVLFVSIYSFAIFIVPVVLHEISDKVFLISGAVSVVVILIFIICLKYISRERFKKSRKILLTHLLGIVVLINVLYFTNLIPPIPLSLKDAGVYHSLVRNSNGNYTALGEDQGFWSFFNQNYKIHGVLGQPIYVYTSVFSPTSLNTSVIHDWQYYDIVTKSWVSTNKIQLAIIGGRDGGYRTYSIKTINNSGLWRVDVKTLRGQIIGRVKFDLLVSTSTPTFVSETL